MSTSGVFGPLVPDCVLGAVALFCARWIVSWVLGGVAWLSPCVCWDAGAVSCPRVLLRSWRPVPLLLPGSEAWLPLLHWL
jgi:hypothetical protein